MMVVRHESKTSLINSRKTMSEKWQRERKFISFRSSAALQFRSANLKYLSTCCESRLGQVTSAGSNRWLIRTVDYNSVIRHHKQMM